MSMIRLTEEQQKPVMSGADAVLVNARSGSGKTAMLVEYALARPDAQILYLAYNKSIRDEAATKFPSNVDCRTSHSLAFGRIGRGYQHKFGDLRPNTLMNCYQIPVLLATYLVEMVYSFLHSADDEIGLVHVPAAIPERNREAMIPMAERVWADMQDLDTDFMPMPHDGYLKLFQLSKPDLGRRYSIILFDEYQDANAVTVDIVKRQTCTKVYVGDRHQSIYAFRGAINAFDLAKDGESDFEEFSLTHSFRFGEGVATLATRLLQGMKGCSDVVVGKGKFETGFTVDRRLPYAVICRTNAKVFAHAVSCLGKKTMHFVGGVDNFPFNKLLDVYTLWNDQAGTVMDPFLRSFESFKELESYGRDAKDKEILALIAVVREYKHTLPGLIEQVRAQATDEMKDAQVVLTSAHKSKGLQFLQVILGNDFEDMVDEQGFLRNLEADELDQEINLLYVALTRAEQNVELNPQLEAMLVALDHNRVRVAAVSEAAPVASSMPVSQLVATNELPVEFAEEELDAMAEGIRNAILKKGLLVANRIATEVGQPVDRVTRKVVCMIKAGELSALLFLGCEHVANALRIENGI